MKPYSVTAPIQRVPQTFADMPVEVALTCLYLARGEYVPKEVEEHGISRFGACDSAGVPCEVDTATHFGWEVAAPSLGTQVQQ